MTAQDWQRYRYTIDPEGQSTANKVLNLVGASKQVLELGCGPGIMTEALRNHYDCRITAIELDPDMAKEAEPYCERLVIDNLETLSFPELFPEQRFDVILAADVLEHLRDPWRCLRDVRKLLSDEGYIVISIPNIAHNVIIAQLLMGRFPYQEKGLLDYTHLRFFTRADLEDMLLGCGFLPVLWERNIAPETSTEFAAQWHQLPEPLRNALFESHEGQTYQFIVKAYPSTEAGWIIRTRRETQQKTDEHRLMQDQLASALADLKEHQIAFNEAKRLLEEREKSLDECNKAFIEARETLLDKVAVLNEKNQALHTLQQEHAILAGETNALIENIKAYNKENTSLLEHNKKLHEALTDAHRTLRSRVVSRVRRWFG